VSAPSLIVILAVEDRGASALIDAGSERELQRLLLDLGGRDVHGEIHEAVADLLASLEADTA
jgi:hypothetical protein